MPEYTLSLMYSLLPVLQTGALLRIKPVHAKERNLATRIPLGLRKQRPLLNGEKLVPLSKTGYPMPEQTSRNSTSIKRQF